MNNLKQSFLSGIVFLGTVRIGFIGFAAWTDLPTQNTGDTLNKDIWNNLVTKVNTIGARVDSLSLGTNQTRQSLKTSRVAGTTYTNSTGKPILVVIYGNQPSQGTSWLYIDGLRIGTQSTVGGGGSSVYGIVPNGSKYYWGGNNGASIGEWFELR